MRAAWRPPHLLLGVHSTVQQPLHRAFRDRRRDWLLGPPGRRIIDDDIGLTAYIGLEFAEKARHFQRGWGGRRGCCGFKRRHGFADEIETASDLAMPEPSPDPLNRFAQAGARLVILRLGVGPALGRLSGSVRIGVNVTNFEAYLRESGSARQIMTARSPDLSAYCSFGRFWREP
jgi:hypothetical protein